MPEMKKLNWDPATKNLGTVTDEQLADLKGLTDDELLRSSQTLDMFSIAESMRRLRVALHKEEKAIKSLTVVLVILTAILVALTGILIWLGVKALAH